MIANARKTLLLVEDEAVIALDEAVTLESFGYRVLTAAGGAEAVETALRNEEIDLILMDIDLGRGIDGTEAARRILEKRSVPIVFLTSHAEREMVERVCGLTRYGYVLKNAGEFVLRSSIEMAFDLFDAHENLSDKNEQLRTLSDRLLGILEHSPLLISEFDMEGRYRLVSRSIGDLFGTAPGHLIGKRFSDLLPPEQVRTFLERIEIVRERLKPVTVNDRMVIEGKERVYSTVIFPLFDAGGSLSSIAGIAHDITDNTALRDTLVQKNQELDAKNQELRTAIDRIETVNEELLVSSEHVLSHQRELEESEARYRALFDNNHSVMLLINPSTGEIVDANPSACQWYGWSNAEIKQKSIADINTLSPEEINSEMELAVSQKRKNFHFRHRLANGI
jgi:PAS domain S-box-containing protein